MSRFVLFLLFGSLTIGCSYKTKEVLHIPIKPDQDKLITRQIQQAIDSCALIGKGTVFFRQGKYKTGGIHLKSNVSLLFEKGALLEGSNNYLDYGEGKWTDALIAGDQVENVSIIGEVVIDGVDCKNEKGEEGFRGPHAIRLTNCKNVTIKDITIKRSANWAINCRHTEDVTIQGVTILGGHDGLHTRFCKNFQVANCDFRTGDDCFAGNDNQHFSISDCKVNTSCNGFRLGCLGLTIKNCLIYGPGEFIHLSQNRNNMLSAFVHFSPLDEHPQLLNGNWEVENVTVKNVDNFFVYNFRDGLWQTGQPASSFTFNNLRVSDVGKAFNVIGDTTRKFNMTIKNSSFSDRKIKQEKDIVFEGRPLFAPALLNFDTFNQIVFQNVSFSIAGNSKIIMAKNGNKISLNNCQLNPSSLSSPYLFSEINEISIPD